MTKNQAVLLNKGISLVNHLVGTKFAYAMAKNSAILEPEMAAIDKANENSKEFAEFQTKRIELAKSMAKKDENGEPKLENYIENGMQLQKYVQMDMAAFNKSLDELRNEYKDAIERRKKQDEEVASILKEDSDIVLYKILLEDVPKEITTGQLQGIFPLIEDPKF